mgnify:CR=1 FL=1
MYKPVFQSLLQIDIRDKEVFPASRIGDINTLLSVVVPTLTIIGVVIFGAMFMWAGYLVLTAGDQPDKLQQARQTAVYAGVGMLIIVAAFLIVRLLAFIFQLEIPI